MVKKTCVRPHHSGRARSHQALPYWPPPSRGGGARQGVRGWQSPEPRGPHCEWRRSSSPLVGGAWRWTLTRPGWQQRRHRASGHWWSRRHHRLRRWRFFIDLFKNMAQLSRTTTSSSSIIRISTYCSHDEWLHYRTPFIRTQVQEEVEREPVGQDLRVGRSAFAAGQNVQFRQVANAVSGGVGVVVHRSRTSKVYEGDPKKYS